MKYTALAPIAVQPGQLVRLTASQLVRCGALVVKTERKGWLEVVIGFQFKVGETFELDAELPKSMADQVEASAAEKAAAEKAAAEKAAAESQG